MDGFIRRRRDEINQGLREAHFNAVLARVEKIKPVDEYLVGEASKPSSDQVPAGEGLAAWAAVLEGLQG